MAPQENFFNGGGRSHRKIQQIAPARGPSRAREAPKFLPPHRSYTIAQRYDTQISQEYANVGVARQNITSRTVEQRRSRFAWLSDLSSHRVVIRTTEAAILKVFTYRLWTADGYSFQKLSLGIVHEASSHAIYRSDSRGCSSNFHVGALVH
jgi:hypothetical protein